MKVTTAIEVLHFAAEAARSVEWTPEDDLEELLHASAIVRYEVDGLVERIKASKVNNTPRPGPVKPAPRPQPKPPPPPPKPMPKGPGR